MTVERLRFTDAASLIAASICELARRGDELHGALPGNHELRIAILERHPRPCGWCVYPRELLADSIAASFHVSVLKGGEGLAVVTDPQLAASVAQMRELQATWKSEAQRLVVEAQAFDETTEGEGGISTHETAVAPYRRASLSHARRVQTDSAEPDWMREAPAVDGAA